MKKKTFYVYWVWHGCTDIKAVSKGDAQELIEEMDNEKIVSGCETGDFEIDHIREE